MRASPVTLAETVFVGMHVAKQPLDSRDLKNATIFQVKAVCIPLAKVLIILYNEILCILDRSCDF